MSDQPLVSIITPVYNGAEYLRECVESVLAQSYSNWDYTILNNWSTDETQAIAEEYALKDRRIRVENNESRLGIIENHNKAFRLISTVSKYCKVVSADDWLFPDCLTRMVSLAEAYPTVGLVGSYQLSGGGSNWRRWRVRWDEIPYPSTFIASRDVCRAQLLDGVYVFGTPTSTLYRSDLVRKRVSFYPNSTAEADTSACYQCLQESDFGFVHQVLSYERIHGKQMSEESRTLNAYAPAKLGDLVTYGSKWLTPTEMAERGDQIAREYYEFLAASAFHRPGKAFWTYHKRRLADCGQPLSGIRLAIAIGAKAADLLLNPKVTIKKVFKRRSS
jgi:glycosyltransferase involved in cell wall biosynthesis